MFTPMRSFAGACFGALLLASTLPSQSLAQIYPEPAPPLDSSHFGSKVRRTMHLLATSTPENRNTVNIIFYGQSITAGQPWVKAVTDQLKARFPHANIIAQDKAVSGFSSDRLINAAELDIYPAYPDLVIFHVYGHHEKYESIIQSIRSRTTAEILITNDHIEGSNPRDSQGNYIDTGWTADMYTYTRNFATKYNCEYVDLRAEWKRYLKANDYLSSQLLQDNVHLNAHGNYLYAELILRQLIHRPDLDPNAEGLTEDYVIGEDIDWDMETGTLSLPFAGNRVDAIYERTSPGATLPAEVWLDGQRPSTFPELYAYTRPSPNPWSNRPVFNRVDSITPKVLEDWTLTITSVSGTTFNYSVSGTVTGADGNGTNTADFVSNSKRVVISGDVFHWFDGRFVQDNAKAAVGQKMTWKTIPLYTDNATYQATSNNIIGTQTLFKGAAHRRHLLQLISDDPAAVGLKALRVHRPSWTRAKKLWADVDEVVFPSEVGAKDTLKVTAEGSWTVTQLPEWLEATPKSGSNNGVVELSVKKKNPTTEEQKATVRINMSGEQPFLLTVVQTAGTGEEDPEEEDPEEEDPGEEDPGEEDPGEEDPGEENPQPVSYFEDYSLINEWRDTTWGYIYDGFWPFAFHGTMGWIYVVEQDGSIFFWNFGETYWGWTAHDYLPWYYAYTDTNPGWR